MVGYIGLLLEEESFEEFRRALACFCSEVVGTIVIPSNLFYFLLLSAFEGSLDAVNVLLVGFCLKW